MVQLPIADARMFRAKDDDGAEDKEASDVLKNLLMKLKEG